MLTRPFGYLAQSIRAAGQLGGTRVNDNDGTLEQQIAQLEGIAEMMRTDLKEAQAMLLVNSGDKKLKRQVAAIEWIKSGVLKKLERLRRQHRAISVAARRASLKIIPPDHD
jgi:hypothetical protein